MHMSTLSLSIYIYTHIHIEVCIYIYILYTYLYIYRRKFRSQASDNMQRWKSRGGKSQDSSQEVRR